VLDVVDELDLSRFEKSYRADGRGAAAYPPACLVALLLYCYSKGVRSSRGIERACWDDVGCRIITANHKVDHSTIARFVRRHRDALTSLFVQVLALCGRDGLVDLSAVAVDGSPMHANASKEANKHMHRLEEVAAECEAQIGAIMENALAHARAVEADPDARDGDATGDQWPQLSRLADRLIRARSAIDRLYERALPSPGEIRAKVEAAERMIARAEERLAAQTAAHQDKLRKYEARAAADLAAGRHGANGRPPVPVERKAAVVRQQDRLAKAKASLERARNPRPVPSLKARACSTDPDSRLVPGKQGGFLQGYNVQIASARRQLLLAIEVHDNPSDMNALVPVVTKARLNQQLAGLPGEVGLWLADSGYACTASFETLADLPLLVSVTSEADLAGFPARRDRPRACHQQMAERLATPAGQAGYRQRGALVEPGFAQLFQRFGRCLHYRGRHAVDTEVKLLGTVHNLNKLINHKARQRS
jgi:transposase